MWYSIENTESIFTPALAVYRDRVHRNIQKMLAMAGSPERLCPHVKTHKMTDVTHLYMEAGVRRFKCATIAEAEMLAQCRVDFVLLAYQPVGPQSQRLVQLATAYRDTHFATIVDDMSAVERLSEVAADAGVEISVMLDVDVGTHRTGIAVGPAAVRLYQRMAAMPALRPAGLHVYDGHIRDHDISLRREHVELAFQGVAALRQELWAHNCEVPEIIAGGSPSFPVHAAHSDRNCSPGTCVFWDAGYADLCPDLDFLPAAVLLMRVISKPAAGVVCVDLGYKAVAAESPPPRARFLNLDDAHEVGHSEEHLVLESSHAEELSVGHLLYAIPHHICPTVALYQQATVVENGKMVDTWKVTARDRVLSV